MSESKPYPRPTFLLIRVIPNISQLRKTAKRCCNCTYDSGTISRTVKTVCHTQGSCHRDQSIISRPLYPLLYNKTGARHKTRDCIQGNQTVVTTLQPHGSCKHDIKYSPYHKRGKCCPLPLTRLKDNNPEQHRGAQAKKKCQTLVDIHPFLLPTDYYSMRNVQIRKNPPYN